MTDLTKSLPNLHEEGRFQILTRNELQVLPSMFAAESIKSQLLLIGAIDDASTELFAEQTRDCDDLKVFRDTKSGVIFIDEHYVGDAVYYTLKGQRPIVMTNYRRALRSKIILMHNEGTRLTYVFSVERSCVTLVVALVSFSSSLHQLVLLYTASNYRKVLFAICNPTPFVALRNYPRIQCTMLSHFFTYLNTCPTLGAN